MHQNAAMQGPGLLQRVKCLPFLYMLQELQESKLTWRCWVRPNMMQCLPYNYNKDTARTVGYSMTARAHTWLPASLPPLRRSFLACCLRMCVMSFTSPAGQAAATGSTPQRLTRRSMMTRICRHTHICGAKRHSRTLVSIAECACTANITIVCTSYALICFLPSLRQACRTAVVTK